MLEKSDTSLSSLTESFGGIVNSNVAKGDLTKKDRFNKPRGRRYRKKPPSGQNTPDVVGTVTFVARSICNAEHAKATTSAPTNATLVRGWDT